MATMATGNRRILLAKQLCFKPAGVMLQEMKCPLILLLGLSVLMRSLSSVGAEVWTVRVEEPTGLYPRTNEVVSVPYAKIGGKQMAWSIIDAQGNELPWQATDEAL